ncbi:hypothetical protein HN51_002184 [Arachis hypogaea]|uniref:Transcription factor n=1 Tax=Arachis hypogaea TaxID=3818 RepID=A0A445ENR0_ARAHY|nr:transcription factor MYB36 [Arachis hypogaea]QHO50358.1 uncharacterized protein DS421_1g21850 [Arachis hypogaea]RYR76992.1 hypothetical protein Ahy_A01g001486 [Arachis hypogaea]
MGRAPCCDKANVKKGPWSPEEDAALKAYIEKNGTGGNWIALPQKIGLKRCGKSCRLRWLNYLRPNIKHGGFTEEEDNIICSLYISIGSRWSIIAAQLPGRTDNDIKNYWNTRLKKKLLGRRKQSSFNSSKDSNIGMQDDTSCSNNNSNALSTSALERLQLHMQLQSLQNPFSFYTNPALWPKLHPFQEKMIHQNLQQQHQSHNLNSHGSNSNNNPLMQNTNNNALPSPHNHVLNQEEGEKDTKNSKVDLLENPLNSNGCSSVLFNNSNPLLHSSSDAIIAPRGDGVEGIQQVCAIQSELDEILNLNSNRRMCYIPQEEEEEEEDQIQQMADDEFDCLREMNSNNNNNGNSKDSNSNLIWWSNDSSADTKSASSNSWESMSSTPVLLPEGMFQDYELGYTL